MNDDIFGDIINKAFYSTSTNSTLHDNRPLTLEDIEKAIDLVYPILYYGTSEYSETGSYIHCDATNFNPEYIVFNPAELETLKEKFKFEGRRLVHLKDEPKEDAWKRIKNNWKFNFDFLYDKESI